MLTIFGSCISAQRAEKQVGMVGKECLVVALGKALAHYVKRYATLRLEHEKPKGK